MTVVYLCLSGLFFIWMGFGAQFEESNITRGEVITLGAVLACTGLVIRAIHEKDHS